MGVIANLIDTVASTAAVRVLESLIFDDRSDFTAAFGLAACESHLVALCHVLSGRLVGLEGHRHVWPADCGARPMIDGARARCSIHGLDGTFAVRSLPLTGPHHLHLLVHLHVLRARRRCRSIGRYVSGAPSP